VSRKIKIPPIPTIPVDENFILLSDGVELEEIKMPLYPDEISEGYSANWSTNDIVGRPVPVGTYVGAGYRSVSFSFDTHRELHPDIDNFLVKIRRACYPTYHTKSGDGYIPRTVFVKIGNFVAIGYITSVNYQWRKPIIDGNYQVCNIQIQMNAIDMGEIQQDEVYDPIDVV